MVAKTQGMAAITLMQQQIETTKPLPSIPRPVDKYIDPDDSDTCRDGISCSEYSDSVAIDTQYINKKDSVENQIIPHNVTLRAK